MPDFFLGLDLVFFFLGGGGGGGGVVGWCLWHLMWHIFLLGNFPPDSSYLIGHTEFHLDTKFLGVRLYFLPFSLLLND